MFPQTISLNALKTRLLHIDVKSLSLLYFKDQLCLKLNSSSFSDVQYPPHIHDPGLFIFSSITLYLNLQASSY